MKFLNFGLVICVALISYTECWDTEKSRAVAKECMEEVGATDDDIENMFNHVPAASTEAKCLHACVMKTFGLINDDGKVDKEKAIEILNVMLSDDEEQHKLGLEVLDACADIDVNENPCEAAEEYRTCMHEKATENGFTLGRV